MGDLSVPACVIQSKARGTVELGSHARTLIHACVRATPRICMRQILRRTELMQLRVIEGCLIETPFLALRKL